MKMQWLQSHIMDVGRFTTYVAPYMYCGVIHPFQAHCLIQSLGVLYSDTMITVMLMRDGIFACCCEEDIESNSSATGIGCIAPNPVPTACCSL